MRHRRSNRPTGRMPPTRWYESNKNSLENASPVISGVEIVDCGCHHPPIRTCPSLTFPRCATILPVNAN